MAIILWDNASYSGDIGCLITFTIAWDSSQKKRWHFIQAPLMCQVVTGDRIQELKKTEPRRRFAFGELKRSSWKDNEPVRPFLPTDALISLLDPNRWASLSAQVQTEVYSPSPLVLTCQGREFKRMPPQVRLILSTSCQGMDKNPLKHQEVYAVKVLQGMNLFTTGCQPHWSNVLDPFNGWSLKSPCEPRGVPTNLPPCHSNKSASCKPSPSCSSALLAYPAASVSPGTRWSGRRAGGTSRPAGACRCWAAAGGPGSPRPAPGWRRAGTLSAAAVPETGGRRRASSSLCSL